MMELNFTSKLATEVEKGDVIRWGPISQMNATPVLQAFYSDFSLTNERLMRVQAIRLDRDLKQRFIIVYEVDPGFLFPATHWGEEDGNGGVTIKPSQQIQESYPAFYLDSDTHVMVLVPSSIMMF